MASDRRTGFPAITPRCRTSSPTVSVPTRAPAACAITRTAKAARKTPASPGCRSPYFIQQMNDFRDGLRKSAEPRKKNTNVMITIAKAMTPEEIKVSAEYFGAMKWTPWVRVVEASTVPKMVSRGGIWIPVEGGGSEPIGTRVVETPENPERTEILRDPRSGFIAYVPVGSIKKGETLAKSRALDCGVCHGADLQGLGPVPGIAGRSPSYLARQMFDMQVGARRGEWAELMKPIVAKLTEEDLVNIVAYVASRMPPAQRDNVHDDVLRPHAASQSAALQLSTAAEQLEDLQARRRYGSTVTVTSYGARRMPSWPKARRV